MKLYQIRDWSQLYENNRTRDLKKMEWVPVPNHHDSDGYTLLVSRKDGAAFYGAWIALVQVASRCDPRGTLLRRTGEPHDPASLSRITRIPEKVFEEMLFVCENECKWLTSTVTALGCDNPAPSCGNPASGCLEGKGMEENGIEGKERNGKEDVFSPSCRALLHKLNEITGRQFRESSASLEPIQARLKEPDVNYDGCLKMIERQAAMWKGTRMEEYLRPSTLFGKEKFNEYYAARELPVPTEHQNGKPNPRNFGVAKNGTDYAALAKSKAQNQQGVVAQEVAGAGGT